MSKFIVVATVSGIVASAHSTNVLASKAARKLMDTHTTVIETSQSVKKGDLWIDLSETSDSETLEAEQELSECDAVIAEQSVKNINTTFAVHKVESMNNCDVMVFEVYNNWLERYETNSEFKTQKEASDRINELVRKYDSEQQIEITPTVSYIAKPQDTRCAWWSILIPQDQQLDGNRLNAPYLRAGADLELKAGDMLIDSEVNHHRKNRGYTVVLGVCDGEKIIFIKPSAEIKRYIKLHGGQDLIHESGDVNGCIRIAVWLRRQSDLNHAVQQLLNT